MVSAELAASQPPTLAPSANGTGHFGRLTVVILGTDGRALAKSRVCIKQTKVHHLTDKDGLGTFTGGGEDTLWATTNEDGRLNLELRLDPLGHAGERQGGPWELFYNASVWVPGIGASYPVAVLVERNREAKAIFQLVPTGEVVGKVIDVHGSPIAGVTIYAFAHNTDFLEMFPTMTDWYLASKSGPDGSYRFGDLVPGGYDMTVTGANATSVLTEASPGAVTVEPRRTVHQDLLALTDHILRGHVVDSQGHPVNGDSLIAIGGGCRFEIGQDGRFELDLRPIPMVHSGPPRLDARFMWWVTNFNDVPGSQPQQMLAGSADVDLSRPLPLDVEVRLQPTGTLLFDVRLGTRQEPAHYFNVHFFHAGELQPPEPGQLRWEAGKRSLNLPCRTYVDTSSTRDMGIRGVPPGVYELWISLAGYRGSRATVAGNHQVVVSPGSTVLLDRLQLVSLPHLTGSVQGADSTLLRAHAFRLYYAPISGGPVREDPTTGLVVEAGRYHVRLLETGRFRGIVKPWVLFRDVDYTRQEGTVSSVFEFEAQDGEETFVDLELHVAPRLRVQVRHPHDVPGLGQYVKIETLDPTTPIPPLVSPVSIRGETESPQVPPGVYLVSILAPGNPNPLASRKVELRATEDVHVVKMEIP